MTKISRSGQTEAPELKNFGQSTLSMGYRMFLHNPATLWVQFGANQKGCKTSPWLVGDQGKALECSKHVLTNTLLVLKPSAAEQVGCATILQAEVLAFDDEN
ncbi:hypothetical protein O181_048271 [Austropuccinia psidii MF-1]|uniref:Uncharacterized protein n=1 Tax=Austropuccinia psidii MF-1 TaxID=1389203 RepID=A0A9Q3HK87_9BASI|nr:hypothetical protein [Austropuccinia psidii MF-1]